MDQFIVSARKYRPPTFDMVVGQRSITTTLKNAIRNQHLAQSFLFTGPRGVGKTTCARILAKTINCKDISAQIEACNVCESCESFKRSHSFNVYELDAASNNTIDDIRNLIDQVRIPPQVGKYKVYIIDEVHMLSLAAFNAFLKILEEPPDYAKFILATTEKHKIIPTILSRCQIFDFARIGVEDILRQLQYVAEQEKVEAETQALRIIAQKADGAMRDALSIFDQIVSLTGNSIAYKQVVENLNVLDYDYYFRMNQLILQQRSPDILLLLDEILMKGFDGMDFLTGLGEHLRSLLMCKDAGTLKLLEVDEDVRARYQEQANACEADFLLQALHIISHCDVNYRASSNKRLMVELGLLQMAGLVKKKSPRPESLTPQLPEPDKSPEALKADPEPASGQAVSSMKTSVPATPLPEKPVKEEGATGQADKPSSGSVTGETPVPSKKTAGNAPPASPPKKPATPLHAISLKIRADVSKETPPKGEDDASDPEKGGPSQQAVSPVRIRQAWNELAESLRAESQGLYLAMTKNEVVITKGNTIRATPDNAIQADELRERKAELMAGLKDRLQTSGIRIEIENPVNNHQQKAYLPKEKLEKLMEKNPDIARLKDALDLDIDY